MEGEIIHVVFAYMNMQKIIIPSEEGQKMAQCLYLKLTHTHTLTDTRRRTQTAVLFSISLSMYSDDGRLEVMHNVKWMCRSNFCKCDK